MPAFKKYYSKCHVLTFNLPMPQLGVKSRRIWVYLPPGYRENENHYPVLYMNDGQNLFDQSTSFCGEWEVGRAINKLVREGQHTGVIVVGIDNGGANRMNEYSPWFGLDVKKTLADEYVHFITDTLKPIIDINFRTLPDKQNTGIAGSSAGGIISFYAAFKYPQIFGRVGIFSPSFWYAWKDVKELIAKADLSQGLRLYLDVGTCEEDKPEDYLRCAKYASKLFASKTGIKQKFVIDEGAPHHESAWSKRFPEAFRWLFAKNS